jgi:hypothetical protein
MDKIKFTVDQDVNLSGCIFRAQDSTSPQAVQLSIDVAGRESGEFSLLPGAYRYEFNIHGSAPPFNLTIASSDRTIPHSGSPFDPADPSLGHSAKMDRKLFFIIH